MYNGCSMEEKLLMRKLTDLVKPLCDVEALDLKLSQLKIKTESLTKNE
jgi:hypothetical protein